MSAVRQHGDEQRDAVSHRWVESTGPRLLLVDRDVGDHLAHELSSRGVHVTAVSSTLTALVQFGRLEPRAVVVAACAGGAVSASDFVREIKQHSCALVVAALDPGVGAEGGELLLAGAAGAITRPYTADALWSVLERSGRLFEDVTVSRGPIEVDSRAYCVRVRGQQVADLPLKEFAMLRLLLRRAPEMVTNEEFRMSLWGADAAPSDNTIAVHVGRLRHRLEGVAQIRRLRGRGYALVIDELDYSRLERDAIRPGRPNSGDD